MTDYDDLLEQPLFRYAKHLDVDQRLRLACRYSDMDELKKALKKGANPDMANDEGMSAWGAAIWSGNVVAMNALLEKWPAPADLLEQVHAMGDHAEILEVLHTHGLAPEPETPAWGIEDINRAIEAMEDARKMFGIEEGSDRHWGYLPFLDDVTVIQNEHSLPAEVVQSLERGDPLRLSLGTLAMASRGVVVFHSEGEAPKLLLSPEMAQELAPRLAQKSAEEEASAVPARRMRH